MLYQQDQTGLDRSTRSTLDFGVKGLKVSSSQGRGCDGGDRGDGATSVTGLKMNVICEAVEVIFRVQRGQETCLWV